MPRKSPRSRSKSTRSSRVPGRSRPRATPGRRQARAEARRDAPAGRRRAHGSRAAGAPARRRAAGAALAGRAARLRRGTRFTPPDPARVLSILEELHNLYPDAGTELRFTTPLQLLIATILSAQCTDERVNMVTPVLFAKYPDAASLANAPQADLEEVIRSTGFYRNKAKAIRACCADI